MARTSLLRLFVGAAGLLLLAAAPASADGLARFEKTLKPAIPPGAMTYKSSKTLGDSGFILEGVVITPPADATPAKTEPIEIKRITVEDIDFDAIEKQAPPTYAKIRIEGIAIKPKPAEGVDLKEIAGIDKLLLNFQLDYKLDSDKETFTLNRLELEMVDLARLELSLIIDGITAEAAGKPGEAMDKATLRTATLVYDDRSLLGKVIPAVAKAQGGDPAAMIEMAKATLEGLGGAGGAEAKAVFSALAAFVGDYKKPKGLLRLTVNPPAKTTIATLTSASSPDEAIKAVGLVISYGNK